ncbi:hypothetical protein vseg_015278 [Gypsophila vaccaria]
MIKLEPKCAKNVGGISFDPNPNWSFKHLLSELNSLESKSFVKSPFREIRGQRRKEKVEAKGFVMRVCDLDFVDSDCEDEADSRSLVPSSKFVYISDSEDSEDEEPMQPLQVALPHKMGVTEGAFLELTHEHELGVKEEQRNQVTAIEAELVAIREKYTSEYAQSLKAIDANREMDRKRDTHYQRKIAVDLDNHLTAIQRDHAQRSQIEERKIRDDAAVEEAKRKEKALHEENLRQQKANAEEQARREAAKKAEELKLAEEVERAKEAAEKLANEKSTASNLLRAAENALKIEEKRLQIYKEIEERNQSILSGSNMDLRPKEREIARRIKQISGSHESVRSRASDLLKIFNDPSIPQSVTVAMFAKKVISIFETPNANFNTSAFACGHVIVYVSAQVPVVMNLLLAELHKVCMYTVPKHVTYSKAAFQTKESYWRSIGFREEDGNLESLDQYLERLKSYMKLYGALIQTEVQGVQNMHGLEEGWTWLAWFLNALPATLPTAVALEAFLRMAGFALYRKYKDQFRKILNAISHEFVHKLKASGKPEINSIITRLDDYIKSNNFLEEPEGWRLRDTLLSHNAEFESQDGGQQQYPQSSYRQPQYQQSSFRQYY